MKLLEEDIRKVMVSDLPEQSEYSSIIYAAQDTIKFGTADFEKAQEANNEAWKGITDLMARCIARGMRLAKQGKEDK